MIGKLRLNKLWLLSLIILATSCSVTKTHQDRKIDLAVTPHLRSRHIIAKSEDSASCQHTKTALNCVKVVDVHDGDTLYIDLPEAPPPFAERLPIRVAGIDAPELSSKDACEKRKALEAKALLESLIHNAKRIDIINVTRDLYFRIGGVVLIDGQSVGKKLLRNKLAYPYYGDKKSKIDWCKF